MEYGAKFKKVPRKRKVSAPENPSSSRYDSRGGVPAAYGGSKPRSVGAPRKRAKKRY